jgi:ABC-type Fe3+-hydroxamate transport system substrate-binding protein
VRDDLGTSLKLTGPPERVVSLVPSLTEAVAGLVPLVGATEYCTHPADLDVTRVGGSKYPDVAAVVALRPDLVLANVEENRREDVEALRAAGIPVWVTYPRTVEAALVGLRRLYRALGQGVPAWVDEADALWRNPAPPVRAVAVVPVWRRPWVVLGSDTFAGDLLAHLGVGNAYGTAGERYPRPRLDEILERAPDLIVLPDEPYAFGPDDGPESFPGRRCAFVSGRHLTWYGPSLVEARALLRHQLGV